MRDRRLARIVHRLVDRHVDNVRRDTARDDQRPPALPLEDLAHELGAEDHTVNVHRHQLPILIHAHLQQALRIAHARVRHKHVDAAKVAHHLLHGRADPVRVLHAHLVRLDLDAELLGEGLALGDGRGVAVVPQGQVAARFGVRLGHGEADSFGRAGDDGHAVVESELREDAVGRLGCWARGAGGGEGFGEGHRHGCCCVWESDGWDLGD